MSKHGFFVSYFWILRTQIPPTELKFDAGKAWFSCRLLGVTQLVYLPNFQKLPTFLVDVVPSPTFKTVNVTIPEVPAASHLWLLLQTAGLDARLTWTGQVSFPTSRRLAQSVHSVFVYSHSYCKTTPVCEQL